MIGETSLSERDNRMDDRRSGGRTRISKAASLLFGGKTGLHSCDVNLTDITDGGAGIYKPGLSVLPVTFELSIDNLRRKCRLVWRKGNSFGVAFENPALPGENDGQAVEGANAIPEAAFSILNDPPQPAYFGSFDIGAECAAVGAGVKNDGSGDLRFTIGVTLALALPVLISISVYVATAAVLRIN